MLGTPHNKETQEVVNQHLRCSKKQCVALNTAKVKLIKQQELKQTTWIEVGIILRDYKSKKLSQQT